MSYLGRGASLIDQGFPQWMMAGDQVFVSLPSGPRRDELWDSPDQAGLNPPDGATSTSSASSSLNLS